MNVIVYGSCSVLNNNTVLGPYATTRMGVGCWGYLDGSQMYRSRTNFGYASFLRLAQNELLSTRTGKSKCYLGVMDPKYIGAHSSSIILASVWCDMCEYLLAASISITVYSTGTTVRIFVSYYWYR